MARSRPTAAAEPLGDMYYFAAAFLDTIGYFDKRKRFWTDEDFPGAEPLRTALEAKVRLIASDAPFAEATLARLAPPDAHENVTTPLAPRARRACPPQGLFLSRDHGRASERRPHDGADLRVSGTDVSHVEEPFP